jgi:hypothetical protein
MTRAYRSPAGVLRLVVMLLATVRVYRRTCYLTWAKSPWSEQALTSAAPLGKSNR